MENGLFSKFSGDNDKELSYDNSIFQNLNNTQLKIKQIVQESSNSPKMKSHRFNIFINKIHMIMENQCNEIIEANSHINKLILLCMKMKNFIKMQSDQIKNQQKIISKLFLSPNGNMNSSFLNEVQKNQSLNSNPEKISSMKNDIDLEAIISNLVSANVDPLITQTIIQFFNEQAFQIHSLKKENQRLSTENKLIINKIDEIKNLNDHDFNDKTDIHKIFNILDTISTDTPKSTNHSTSSLNEERQQVIDIFTSILEDQLDQLHDLADISPDMIDNSFDLNLSLSNLKKQETFIEAVKNLYQSNVDLSNAIKKVTNQIIMIWKLRMKQVLLRVSNFIKTVDESLYNQFVNEINKWMTGIVTTDEIFSLIDENLNKFSNNIKLQIEEKNKLDEFVFNHNPYLLNHVNSWAEYAEILFKEIQKTSNDNHMLNDFILTHTPQYFQQVHSWPEYCILLLQSFAQSTKNIPNELLFEFIIQLRFQKRILLSPIQTLVSRTYCSKKNDLSSLIYLVLFFVRNIKKKPNATNALKKLNEKYHSM